MTALAQTLSTFIALRHRYRHLAAEQAVKHRPVHWRRREPPVRIFLTVGGVTTEVGAV